MKKNEKKKKSIVENYISSSSFEGSKKGPSYFRGLIEGLDRSVKSSSRVASLAKKDVSNLFPFMAVWW
jgi:hypothetical protein